MLLRGLVALLILLRSAEVCADACDPTEVAALRAHLTEQAAKADTWNSAWRWIFTGAAVGTLALGLVDPVPEWKLRDGLLVSSGKATIGAAARWFMPLRIRVPSASNDACVDVAVLRAEVARVAKKERTLFIMGHIGGIAVNLGGAAIIWYRQSFGAAALSVAIGYPVGVLSNYTMPRGTWKLHRDVKATWTAGVVPSEHGWLVTAAGTF